MPAFKAPHMQYDGEDWHMDFESYDPSFNSQRSAQYHALLAALEPRQITVGIGTEKKLGPTGKSGPGPHPAGTLLKVVYVNSVNPLSNTHLALCPSYIREESLTYSCDHYELKTSSILFRFAAGFLTKYYTFNIITNVYHKKDTTMNDLFTIIDGEHKGKFVTKIGMNSAGDYVVEVRGTGEVFAVPTVALEKVMPYTVNVRYIGNNSKIYSFFANKDDVAVGDVIFGNNYDTPMIVKAIDTKSATATTWLAGSVVKASKVIEAPKE